MPPFMMRWAFQARHSQIKDHFDVTVLLLLDNRQPLPPLSPSQCSSLQQKKRNLGTVPTDPNGTSRQVNSSIKQDQVFLSAANKTFVIPQRPQHQKRNAGPWRLVTVLIVGLTRSPFHPPLQPSFPAR